MAIFDGAIENRIMTLCYPYGVACVIPGLATFAKLPTCDRQTDGRTHDDSIYRASIASHGENYLTV